MRHYILKACSFICRRKDSWRSQQSAKKPFEMLFIHSSVFWVGVVSGYFFRFFAICFDNCRINTLIWVYLIFGWCNFLLVLFKHTWCIYYNHWASNIARFQSNSKRYTTTTKSTTAKRSNKFTLIRSNRHLTLKRVVHVQQMCTVRTQTHTRIRINIALVLF